MSLDESSDEVGAAQVCLANYIDIICIFTHIWKGYTLNGFSILVCLIRNLLFFGCADASFMEDSF